MCDVTVIGGGLAGCEAACRLSKMGINVRLYEMKPERRQPAHKTDLLCELVCSNSLRSEKQDNAAGLLKEEMRKLDSAVISCADRTRLPAGSALAVDRTLFAEAMTEKIKSDPRIALICEEIREIPEGIVVIATGPLTDGGLLGNIENLLGESLHFYDAAAPIVTYESLDMNKIYRASRYGRGSDYLNCPMTRLEYFRFLQALTGAEQAVLHDFERGDVFEGCIPVEIMAKQGALTLAYGPMKPVGLENCIASDGKKPFAVAQLRQDNIEGTLFNIVGFQTNLKFTEQKRVFSMIPGLENAEFIRYGVMHRNSFLRSPGILNWDYSLKKDARIFFAGQMTGVEGYIESASSGLIAGLNAAFRAEGRPLIDFTRKTAMGALAHYVSEYNGGNFQPMNVNFGIMESLAAAPKDRRKRALAFSARALEKIEEIRLSIQ